MNQRRQRSRLAPRFRSAPILTALLIGLSAAFGSARTGSTPAGPDDPAAERSTASDSSATGALYVATSGDDSNPGTSEKPWRTIGHAAAIAGQGDIVHVSPGVYRENVLITRSGTAEQPVRFVSDQKWGAQIIGVTYDPTVRISAGHIVFANFAVSNPGGPSGIEVTGAGGSASYDRVIGNEVYDVAGPCKLGRCAPGHYSGGGGIILSNTTDNLDHDDDAIGNVIHDIGDPRNPQNADLVHGIYIELGGDVDYPRQGRYSARVENNVIFRVEGDGITSWHCATHAVIVNNTVVDAGVHGILLSASEECGANAVHRLPNRQSVVANNIVYHCGWHAQCSLSAVAHLRCLRPSFGGGCGIVVSNAEDATVSHNLLGDNLCRSDAGAGLAILTTADSHNTVADNLTDADPGFVKYNPDGSGDFHLRSGSPAVAAGAAKYGVTRDIDGRTRPEHRAPSIGAYEYPIASLPRAASARSTASKRRATVPIAASAANG